MRGLGKISVIIPNNNRDLSTLKNWLDLSTYKDFELVEVNVGLERSVQRNMGISMAKGEYLLFLDSDQLPSPFLLQECVEKMNRYYDVLYIPEEIITEGLFGRIRNWERQFYTGTSVDVIKFVRRHNCPLFDTQQHGTEDSDWDRQIGGKRGVCTNFVYHDDNVRIQEYFKKKAYYAKSLSRFAERNPGDKILDFKYRCWTVFTENGKWQRLFHPYIFGLILVLFIRGLIYLCRKR